MKNYLRNVFSQNGEDGIIEFLLGKIEEVLPSEKWCVEFGAWDGKHLSNTFNLIQQGWNAVHIEGHDERYKDLLKTVSQYPKIVPIKAMVGFETDDPNKLDLLLEQTDIPEDYELLSIDIDSFDLAVWNAYSGKPKIVIIETNSSIPHGIEQWHEPGKFQGNSFTSTVKVAQSKGYELVFNTGNLILMRADLTKYLDLPSPEILSRKEYVRNS